MRSLHSVKNADIPFSSSGYFLLRVSESPLGLAGGAREAHVLFYYKGQCFLVCLLNGIVILNFIHIVFIRNQSMLYIPSNREEDLFQYLKGIFHISHFISNESIDGDRST